MKVNCDATGHCLVRQQEGYEDSGLESITFAKGFIKKLCKIYGFASESFP